MCENIWNNSEIDMFREKLNDSVIRNIVKFLNSNARFVMERCYKCIRKSNDNRILPESMSKKEFKSFIPLVTAVITTANKIECDSLNYVISCQENTEVKKVDNALDIFGGSSLNPEVYLFKLHSRYFLHLRAQET